MNKLFAIAASVIIFAAVIAEAKAAEPAATEAEKTSASKEGRAKLSPQERAARREARSKKMFERMDANKDGAISKEEHLKIAEEKFHKRDANNDGKITREEAKAYSKNKKGAAMDDKAKAEIHGGHHE